MKSHRTAPSRILAEVREAAHDLHEAGAINVLTVREFDALCLLPVPAYKADDVRRIRTGAKASQSVFAACLNVKPATVAAWEQGNKEPSGPALKLLQLVERKGLDMLL